jgi:hypothetical protein
VVAPVGVIVGVVVDPVPTVTLTDEEVAKHPPD